MGDRIQRDLSGGSALCDGHLHPLQDTVKRVAAALSRCCQADADVVDFRVDHTGCNVEGQAVAVMVLLSNNCVVRATILATPDLASK